MLTMFQGLITAFSRKFLMGFLCLKSGRIFGSGHDVITPSACVYVSVLLISIMKGCHFICKKKRTCKGKKSCVIVRYGSLIAGEKACILARNGVNKDRCSLSD